MPPKYRDKRTRQFADGARVPAFQQFERQTLRRLELLEAARTIADLMMVPSNRFESLGGDRRGQFSIRINDKWRICFEWPEALWSLSTSRLWITTSKENVRWRGHQSIQGKFLLKNLRFLA